MHTRRNVSDVFAQIIVGLNGLAIWQSSLECTRKDTARADHPRLVVSHRQLNDGIRGFIWMHTHDSNTISKHLIPNFGSSKVLVKKMLQLRWRPLSESDIQRTSTMRYFYPKLQLLAVHLAKLQRSALSLVKFYTSWINDGAGHFPTKREFKCYPSIGPTAGNVKYANR